jgi:BirA family transcriptional regulator, biotin operon repressor / biotin---[acetyl-CoA-carboxylase] ligase
LKTLFIGQVLMNLSQTESTNKFGSELIRSQKVFEGMVINSNEQTSGRGQRGQSWHSEKGKNLTFSVILKPAFLTIENQFQLSKCVALAIADFISIFEVKQVKVKWPNDIYVNGRKIAGILIENQIKNGKISYSIVGIGININQIAFPVESKNPTSLKIITGIDFALDNCLELICSCIEKRYLELRSGAIIDNEYLSKLHQFGEWQNYESEDKIFSGKIIGIANNGKLRMETVNEIKEFDLKEISFI